MNEYQKRFVALLKTIFELDKSDLDFGIYRIINIRQREIVDYFENRLPKKIQEILINGKTKCSTFTKHFVLSLALLTQNKMCILSPLNML